MIDELEWVRHARPQVDAPSPAARRRARHALDEAMAKAGKRRGRRLGLRWLSPGNLAAAAALLVVVAVVGVFLGTHSHRPAAPVAQGGPELVFRAEPAARIRGVPRDAVAQAAALLQRLIPAAAGERSPVSVRSAGDSVIVQLGQETPATRLRMLSLAAVTGRLAFYDWEANALTRSGESTASVLTTQNPSGLLISQGGSASAPGSPGAGSMSLYSAVRLAAAQRVNTSADNGRPGAEYFAFGRAGSPGCAAAARYYGTRVEPGSRCYLAGPAPSADQLVALVPPGVSPAAAETLVVPPGTLVLAAVPSSGFARGPTLANPGAQFYVLRDHPGLLGTSIISPSIGADASGSPDIQVGFTSRGKAAFHRVTAQIAQRGDLVSGLGQTLDQHLAIALGDQLVTVPSIDFKTYPDGVPGAGGAGITGGFTRRSSQTAFLEVRLGSLPITLRLSSVSR